MSRILPFFRLSGRQPSERALQAYHAANSRMAARLGVPVFAFSAGLRCRSDLRDLFREAGLSRKDSERAAAGAWRALSPNSRAAETADTFRAAAQMMRALRD